MPVTVNISEEILAAAGYIGLDDPGKLRQAGLVKFDDLTDIRLNVCQIAEFLGVGHGRVRRYFRYKRIPLGEDGKMSLKEILTRDWSEVTDLTNKGDKQRKKTHFA